MTAYRALLVDFYGTLVAEDDHLTGPIRDDIAARSPLTPTPAEVGRDWPFHDLCYAAYGTNFQTQRDLETQSLRDLMARYEVDGSPEEWTDPLFAYWQNPTPFPDGEWFVKSVRLPYVIVSNIDTEDLNAACARQGWKFPRIVTSEGCRAYKPRPEMFRRALGLLGCKPSEVLVIGDSLRSDITGAGRLGIDSVWVNRTARKPPADFPPTYTIRDLTELRGILPADAF